MGSIEAAPLDDIPQLADLLLILFTQEADFAPDREKQERRLRLLIKSPAVGQIFVAWSGSEAVGVVSLLLTVSTAEGGPVWWLEDMVVRRDCRGRGLGSFLPRHAVDFTKNGGFTRLTLLTDRVNEGSVRFYERQRFRASETKMPQSMPSQARSCWCCPMAGTAARLTRVRAERAE